MLSSASFAPLALSDPSHDFGLLRDLALLFVAAVIVVGLFQRLRLPAIAGLIVTGTLVGPGGLGLIPDTEEVRVLAELGVVALLFGVGLELPVSKLRRLWQPVLIGGTLQMTITTVVVALAARAFGATWNVAWVLGGMVAVSSTAIVLRGLQERGEMEAPHGRSQLGILVFQDLLVVPMMLLLPLFAGVQLEGGVGGHLLDIGVRAGALLLGLVFIGRPVVGRLLEMVAKTRQPGLFVLVVLALALGTAWIAAQAGLSLALGAFLAGILVAGSEYRHQAVSELLPFQEAFSSIFFLSVGMLLRPGVFVEAPMEVGGLVAGVLVVKAAVLFLVGWMMRLPLRVTVLVALGLAEVGEFSFLLLTEARALELMAPALEDAFLAAIIVTMLIAPGLARVAPWIADRMQRGRVWDRWFVGAEGRAGPARPGRQDHVVVAGYGLAGAELAGALREQEIPYLVLDLNPDNVRAAQKEGHPALYGDVTRRPVLERAGVRYARRMVMAINDPAAGERAIRAVRAVAPDVPLIVRAPYLADVESLERCGATEVVATELESAAEMVERVLRREGLDEETVQRQLGRCIGGTGWWIRWRRRGPGGGRNWVGDYNPLCNPCGSWAVTPLFDGPAVASPRLDPWQMRS